ncbi:MAG: hypothetical protein IJT44_00680 [Clostridia bacterium]|nr:hypothetical protein [Clostridia bacterium]
MKKTIAALLVTILASAGYIVLDKAAVEKIDRLESQVSVQQQVIDSFGAPLNTMDMEIGETIPCYPAAGTTVQAYVRDLSLTTTWATTTMTQPAYSTTRPALTTATSTTTTTTTTKPETTYSVPTGTTYRAESTTRRADSVRAQSDEPPVPTGATVPDPTVKPTAEPTVETTVPEPTIPTTWYSFDELYHLRTDVSIRSFLCKKVGTSMTGIPTFAITLSGKVDPSYADREIEIILGNGTDEKSYSYAMIRSDGSFSIETEAALTSASVIPLFKVIID